MIMKPDEGVDVLENCVMHDMRADEIVDDLQDELFECNRLDDW